MSNEWYWGDKGPVTYTGPRGEKVEYSPKQRAKFAQRAVPASAFETLRRPVPPVTPEEDEWFAHKSTYTIEPLPESARRIAQECDRIKALLIEKNLSYGDSALNPVQIFSDASPVQRLGARIDDKLSRKAKGRPFEGDNDRVDLIGYLILLGLAEEDA